MSEITEMEKALEADRKKLELMGLGRQARSVEELIDFMFLGEIEKEENKCSS